MDLTEGIVNQGEGVVLGTIRWHVKETYLVSDYHLDDHRKRLIFIERWFDGTEKRRQRNTRIALVWGCCFTKDLQWDGINKKEIAWNGFDSLYWPQFRYERLLQKMVDDKRPTPKFARFAVIVSTLPYIKHLEDDFSNITLHNNKPNRRYGHHLYMRPNGTIMAGFIYENYNNRLGFHMKCMDQSVSPIHHIYPVIRYEWEAPEPKSVLTFGLDFRFLGNARTDDQTGDRYYHRYGDQCLRVGNVFELTEVGLKSIDTIDPTRQFIGLYVCAGAKLLVYDTYQADKGSTKHNRTLIQQGGFVVCRGPFQIDLPLADIGQGDKVDDYFAETKLTRMDWKPFCDKCLIDVDNKADSEVRPNPGTMRQPVLFLGPINSRFGALTWGVEVRKDSLPTKMIADRRRKTVLYTPNHSRIIAIADGKKAFEEIKARIKYEILHDSVVTQHETGFEIPTKPVQTQTSSEPSSPGSPSSSSPSEKKEPDTSMVRRILNVGNERSFDIDYPTGTQECVGDDTIFNFNITTVLGDGFEEGIKKFLTTQTTRLAVPPMFPPAVVIDQQGEANICSIPSQQFAIENFDNLYNNSPGRRIQFIDTVDRTNMLFRFKHYDESVSGYHFKRLQKKEEQSFADKSGNYQDTDPVYRLGVDGWMWKSDGKNDLQEDTYCFFYSALQSQVNTHRRGRSRRGQNQGPKRGQNRGQDWGQNQGQSHGSSQGPSRGSNRGSGRGSSRGSGRGSSRGSGRGSSNM